MARVRRASSFYTEGSFLKTVFPCGFYSEAQPGRKPHEEKITPPGRDQVFRSSPGPLRVRMRAHVFSHSCAVSARLWVPG